MIAQYKNDQKMQTGSSQKNEAWVGSTPTSRCSVSLIVGEMQALWRNKSKFECIPPGAVLPSAPQTPPGHDSVRLPHPTGHSRWLQPSEWLELFTLLTWISFLPDSRCWSFKEDPRDKGQSGKGSHWDGDQHSHKCCHARSRRPGQTGTVSMPATSRLFLNRNKKLWNVYTESWVCSCLGGNTVLCPECRTTLQGQEANTLAPTGGQIGPCDKSDVLLSHYDFLCQQGALENC